MFTICSLYVHYMFTIYSLCIHYMFYKIRTRTNFENPNDKSLDLHLILWFTLKQLFPGSTDFTEAICKIYQISEHFLAI